MSQVAAVLKRCAAQSAAGGPRCSELDRYMANCIKVKRRPKLFHDTYRAALTHAEVARLRHRFRSRLHHAAITRRGRAALRPEQHLLEAHKAVFTSQVHGPQCLRCTYSTVKKVGARDSCCTAVRDRRAYAIQRCQAGEA